MKIFCIGRNYAEHAKELKNELSSEPVIFIKPKTALLKAGMPFHYPEFTNDLHYEAELVLRISKNGRYISAANAVHYFNAITVGIDFTARDIQNDLKQKGLPWEKAKAWDCSAVVGKWFDVNPEMLQNPINFSLNLNGKNVQKGDSSHMLFSFSRIIADIAKYFALNIGDLVFTGTPAGVGECVGGDILEGFFEEEKVFQVDIK